MTDVSDEIRRAASESARWSSSSVRAALQAVVDDASGRRAEWDEDAGERWARVLGDEGVVALVSAEIPFIFTRSDATSGPAAARWHVVPVSAIDAKELSADLMSIQAGFPELASALRDQPTLLDLTGFSAEGLWFASV